MTANQTNLAEYEKIVAAKDAKNLPDGIRIYPLFRDGSQVKGKRLLGFVPYIHPSKSANENFTNLNREASGIQSVFPNYKVPSLAQIETIVGDRRNLKQAVMKAGAIAELSLPKSAIGYFSKLL